MTATALAPRLAREAEAARHDWISRAWELGEELARVRSVLVDALNALQKAQHGERILALACSYFAGGLGDDEPRDLPLERTAIAYLMAGQLEPEQLAGVGWASRHQHLVNALAELDLESPTLIEELALKTYHKLRARPLQLARALAAAVKGLDEADSAEAVVLRLEALQRQRSALAAAIRAVRELRSVAGDHSAARAHLTHAIRQLDGAS